MQDMNRRGFLGSILALGVAPAIVRADSLMRVIPRNTGIIAAFDLTGNGRHLYHFKEVMVFPTAHTEAERRMMQGYLAGGMGIARWDEAKMGHIPAVWYRLEG